MRSLNPALTVVFAFLLGSVALFCYDICRIAGREAGGRKKLVPTPVMFLFRAGKVFLAGEVTFGLLLCSTVRICLF